MNNTTRLPIGPSSTPENMSTSSEVYMTFDIWSYPLASNWRSFRLFFYPVMILLGVFGNVMTIVIIRRLKKKSASSCLDPYFLIVAVTDLCSIMLGPFPVWLSYFLGYSFLVTHDVVCKIGTYVLNVSGFCSVWTLTVMAAHRALMVTWPHRVKSMCTPKRSQGVLTGVFVFFCLVNIHYLYMGAVSPASRVCTYRQVFETFNEVWFFISLILNLVLPIICMSLSNTILISKLRVSVREAGDQLANSQTELASRKKTVNSVTLTAVVVSIVFVLITLPLAMSHIVDHVFLGMTGITSFYDFVVRLVIRSICFFFNYLSHIVNFYLYCLTGKKFRDEVKDIFCSLRQHA